MTSYRRLNALLFGIDTALVVVAFNLVYRLRGLDSGQLLLAELLLPLGMLAFMLHLIDGYSLHTDMLSADYMGQHLLALLLATIGTILLTFVFFPGGYLLQASRGVVVLSFAALVPLTLATRRFLYQRYAIKRGQRSLVFVGDRESCIAFREDCMRSGNSQPIVYAVVTEQSTDPFPGSEEKPRVFREVITNIERGALSAEAIVLRESGRELLADVSERLVNLYFSGVPTYTLELFHQIYWRKIPLYRLNQTWLFQEGFQIAREPVFERVKRISDIGFSISGLILSSPLLLAAALAVRFGDGGPVFYRQTRIGKDRRPFTAFKLRTMRASPEGDPYTQPGDSRITPVGRVLRKIRLDEFPQLWNVLRGEMSLIGPRAEWDRLVARYQAEIPCYHFRHLVRPGITGWAQVNYPYGTGIDDTVQKLEYDLYYIRHFSFRLDASIVIKTIHVILFGKGR